MLLVFPTRKTYAVVLIRVTWGSEVFPIGERQTSYTLKPKRSWKAIGFFWTVSCC